MWRKHFSWYENDVEWEDNQLAQAMSAIKDDAQRLGFRWLPEDVRHFDLGDGWSLAAITHLLRPSRSPNGSFKASDETVLRGLLGLTFADPNLGADREQVVWVDEERNPRYDFIRALELPSGRLLTKAVALKLSQAPRVWVLFPELIRLYRTEVRHATETDS